MTFFSILGTFQWRFCRYCWNGNIDVGDRKWNVWITQMLMTIFAILITNIHYLFKSASGTIIEKMSPRSLFCHQRPIIVTNFESPTSLSLSKFDRIRSKFGEFLKIRGSHDLIFFVFSDIFSRSFFLEHIAEIGEFKFLKIKFETNQWANLAFWNDFHTLDKPFKMKYTFENHFCLRKPLKTK